MFSFPKLSPYTSRTSIIAKSMGCSMQTAFHGIIGILARTTTFYFIVVFTFFVTGIFNTIAYFDSQGPYLLVADTLPKLLNIYVLMIFTVFTDRSNIPSHLFGFGFIVACSGALVVAIWVLQVNDMREQSLTAMLGNAAGMLQGLASAWYVFIVAVPEVDVAGVDGQETV